MTPPSRIISANNRMINCCAADELMAWRKVCALSFTTEWSNDEWSDGGGALDLERAA